MVVLGPGELSAPSTLIEYEVVVVIEVVSTENCKLVESKVKREGRKEPLNWVAVYVKGVQAPMDSVKAPIEKV